MDFPIYSYGFHTQHFDGYFYYALQLRYGLSTTDAAGLAPYFRNAIMAHYAGEENLSTSPDKATIEYLAANEPLLARLFARRIVGNFTIS